MFEMQVEVLPEQLDQTYGHIHHADALRFWERCRLSFLVSLGFPTESYIAKGLLWVISGIEVQYKRELRAGPHRITCENGRIDGKTLILHQRIFNERNKVAVEGMVHCMLLSKETSRAAAIPDDFRLALEAKYPKEGEFL